MSQQRPPRSLRRGLLISAGLCVAIAVGWWLAFPRTTGAIIFPDGTWVSLAAAAYGTNHYAPPVTRNWALDRLPGAAWVGRILGLPSCWRVTSPSPVLGMWLKCDLSRSDANEIERWEYHWVLVDSQGVEAGLAAEEEPRRLFLQGMASSMANGEPYVLWRATDLFPRRSPWMILRAYARRIFDGQIVPAGELVFSNPAYDPDLPNWKAESTPVVRTFEGHRFQCDGLSISRQAGGRPGLDFPVATLKVRSICSAGVCSHWRPSTITITTASGNSRTWTRDHSNPATEFWGVALSEKELPGEWCFEWWLWDDEPSYAVEVEWLPDPVITLAPGEFCYVPAVRLPAEDGVTRINVSTNLAGVPVKVLAVVGEHASFPERLRDVTATSTLEIEVGEVPTSHRFLVIDRALPEEARIGLQALEPGLRSFRLPSKTAETSHVDLCLAIYRRCLTRCIVRAEFGREER